MTINDKERYLNKLLVDTKNLTKPLLSAPNCNSKENIKEAVQTCLRLAYKGFESNREQIG